MACLSGQFSALLHAGGEGGGAESAGAAGESATQGGGRAAVLESHGRV